VALARPLKDKVLAGLGTGPAAARWTVEHADELPFVAEQSVACLILADSCEATVIDPSAPGAILLLGQSWVRNPGRVTRSEPFQRGSSLDVKAGNRAGNTAEGGTCIETAADRRRGFLDAISRDAEAATSPVPFPEAPRCG
jgi:hypothetical protein